MCLLVKEFRTDMDIEATPLAQLFYLFWDPDRSLLVSSSLLTLQSTALRCAFPLILRMLSGMGTIVIYILPMRKLMLKEIKEFAYSPLAGSQGIHCQDKVRGQPLVSGIVSPSFSSTEKEMGFVSDSGKPSSLSAPRCFCW